MSHQGDGGDAYNGLFHTRDLSTTESAEAIFEGAMSQQKQHKVSLGKVPGVAQGGDGAVQVQCTIMKRY
jgi:hypothetical protein